MTLRVDRRWLWLGLAGVPILYVLGYLARYSLDIPCWDQWDFLPTLVRAQDGQLTLGELLAQYNEHRPLFPRLLWLALAQPTGWNTHAEIALNVILAAFTFGVFYAHTARVLRAAGRPKVTALLPLLSLLVFSVSQWESWLFGFQTIMFLGMAAVVSGMLVLARGTTWRNVLAGAALGAVGTYSMANALLYWPIALLMIWRLTPRESRWPFVIVWCLLGGAVSGAFLYDWTPIPVGPAPEFSSFERALDYSNWVFSYLGGTVPGYPFPFTSGILGLILLGFGTWWLTRIEPMDRRLLAPYLALAAFTIVSAFVIGVGRSGLGAQQALSSRYVTMTLWYWAVLLTMLYVMATSDSWGRLTRHGRWARAFSRLLLFWLALKLVVGAGIGTAVGIHWRYARVLPVYTALRNRQPVSDGMLLQIRTKDPAELRQLLALLQQRQLSLYRP